MSRTVQMMILVASSSLWSGSATRLANGPPFRKLKEVMDLLGAMREKVLDEGRQQAELFDKFQCYCTTNTASLADKIETVNRLIEPMKSVACHIIVCFLGAGILPGTTELGACVRKSARSTAKAAACRQSSSSTSGMRSPCWREPKKLVRSGSALVVRRKIAHVSLPGNAPCNCMARPLLR